MAETVVLGMSGLQRALRFADREIGKDLRASLRDAAEPVRADAETLARSTIPRVGIPWSGMRIGVTRTVVYVAPKKRGKNPNARLRRPRFKDLLLDRAMNPALARNESQIEGRVIATLNNFADRWARVG
jgi:hypothetical protein